MVRARFSFRGQVPKFGPGRPSHLVELWKQFKTERGVVQVSFQELETFAAFLVGAKYVSAKNYLSAVVTFEASSLARVPLFNRRYLVLRGRVTRALAKEEPKKAIPIIGEWLKVEDWCKAEKLVLIILFSLGIRLKTAKSLEGRNFVVASRGSKVLAVTISITAGDKTNAFRSVSLEANFELSKVEMLKALKGWKALVGNVVRKVGRLWDGSGHSFRRGAAIAWRKWLESESWTCPVEEIYLGSYSMTSTSCGSLVEVNGVMGWADKSNMLEEYSYDFESW